MCSKNLHRAFKNNNKNECSICQRTPEHLKKLLILVKINSNVLYLCDSCFQKVSLTENTMTEFLHFSKNKKEKFNVCKSCHKRFSLQKFLKKHNISVAEGKNIEPMCQTCVEKLSIKENLKRHCLSYTKNLICKICKEVFSSIEELEIHHFAHIEKYEMCKTCKMKISSVGRLQSQMCQTCEENLLLKKTLKEHCLSHKNREVERKLSKTILKMHCLVLAPNTPFVCGICKDSFSSRNELLQHYPVHTGERSHELTNCKKNHYLLPENNHSPMKEIYF